MSSAKRYVINHGDLCEHPDGSLAKFSDYAALEAQLAAVKAENERLREADNLIHRLEANTDVHLCHHKQWGHWVLHRGDPNLNYIASSPTILGAIRAALQPKDKDES